VFNFGQHNIYNISILKKGEKMKRIAIFSIVILALAAGMIGMKPLISPVGSVSSPETEEAYSEYVAGGVDLAAGAATVKESVLAADEETEAANTEEDVVVTTPATPVAATTPATPVAATTPAAAPVAAAPETVSIPVLLGMDSLMGKMTLMTLGVFPGEVSSEYSEDVPAGWIIRTTPEAGAVVPLGTTVSFVISSGPAPVAEPEQ
jgi:hypothetical protein